MFYVQPRPITELALALGRLIAIKYLVSCNINRQKIIPWNMLYLLTNSCKFGSARWLQNYTTVTNIEEKLLWSALMWATIFLFRKQLAVVIKSNQIKSILLHKTSVADSVQSKIYTKRQNTITITLPCKFHLYRHQMCFSASPSTLLRDFTFCLFFMYIFCQLYFCF